MHLPSIILFLNLGGGEIMLVVMFIIMFFGADKLPEMARAIGKGMKEMKNATAEIQREIEKSTVEIQRDINLGSEINELKEATDKITKRISQGLNDLEDHHNITKEITAGTKEVEDEKENPLVPPDAIKREE